MYNDLIENAIQLFKDGVSTLEIAAKTGKSQRQIQRYVKKYKESILENIGELDEIKESDNKIHKVLVIPDMHCPFTKEEYIDWLKKLYDENNCDTVVCLGDLVDIHTISSHQAEPSGLGTITEYKKALDFIKKIVSYFPNVKYCMGNHDIRIAKQAASIGIPSEFLKSFRELYNLPYTWEIAESFIIDDVLYTHGTEYTGRNSITNITNLTHKSTVVGHMHSNFGVFYTNSGYDQLFTMMCGCLLDSKAYAFAYGKNNKFKPVLGAGIVKSSSEAFVIPYTNF